MERFRVRFARIAGVLALVGASCLPVGCSTVPGNRPPGSWEAAYRPIESAEVDAFVAFALDRATRTFGPPARPVREVRLRRSKKASGARGYRLAEDFSLTECVDPSNGIYVVYLAADPGDPNFYPLLGHECAHLIDPRIYDWYMEGIATVFSEETCRARGLAWGGWRRRFERDDRDPYALSYRMMRELKAAFPIEYPALVSLYAEENPARWARGRRRIEVDGWIASLPAARRGEARAIIARYAKGLRRHAKKPYAFEVPRSDGRPEGRTKSNPGVRLCP